MQGEALRAVVSCGLLKNAGIGAERLRGCETMVIDGLQFAGDIARLQGMTPGPRTKFLKSPLDA